MTSQPLDTESPEWQGYLLEKKKRQDIARKQQNDRWGLHRCEVCDSVIADILFYGVWYCGSCHTN